MTTKQQVRPQRRAPLTKKEIAKQVAQKSVADIIMRAHAARGLSETECRRCDERFYESAEKTDPLCPDCLVDWEGEIALDDPTPGAKLWSPEPLTDDELAIFREVEVLTKKRGLRPTQRRCFYNSQNLAFADPRLRYVEGIAADIHHGWVALGDKVIDATWTAGAGARPETSYYGVAIETSAVASRWASSGKMVRVSMLDDREIERMRQELDPARRERARAALDRAVGT